MSLHWLTLFGAALTALAALTSAGMILCAANWSKIEAWAYGDARRPWPVRVMAGLLLAIWALGLADTSRGAPRFAHLTARHDHDALGACV